MINIHIIKQDFFLDGVPTKLYSGAVHYFRVPRQYWYDRLMKLKSAGLNGVETYVPWNLHEPRPGQFDFAGDLDVEHFLALAKEVGLFVLLRPGPYICSEWDWGGLPYWLLQERDYSVIITFWSRFTRLENAPAIQIYD